MAKATITIWDTDEDGLESRMVVDFDPPLSEDQMIDDRETLTSAQAIACIGISAIDRAIELWGEKVEVSNSEPN